MAGVSDLTLHENIDEYINDENRIDYTPLYQTDNDIIKQNLDHCSSQSSIKCSWVAQRVVRQPPRSSKKPGRIQKKKLTEKKGGVRGFFTANGGNKKDSSQNGDSKQVVKAPEKGQETDRKEQAEESDDDPHMKRRKRTRTDLFDREDEDEDEDNELEEVSRRLERLKQWRQEKRRKAKKNGEGKKPRFTISPRIDYRESDLYRSTDQVKPTKFHAASSKKNAAGHPAKEAVKPVSGLIPVKVRPVSDQAIIHKSASRSVTARPKSQAVKDTPVVSGQPSTSSEQPVTQVTTRQRGRITDLSTKLTAAQTEVLSQRKLDQHQGQLRIRGSRRVKKCPARYGLANKATWCMMCRRKKKCIRFPQTWRRRGSSETAP